MKRIKLNSETTVKLLYFSVILAWVSIIGFDIKMDPLINIIIKIFLALITLIAIILVIHDRKNIVKELRQNKKKIVINLIKFIGFIIIFVTSIRGGGQLAFWIWIIYGLYRLWLSDNKNQQEY